MLALVFMAIAVPTVAANIFTSGMLLVDHNSSNRFCVGKTIDYMLVVGNLYPGNKNATMTVYDRYPNGTVELLEEDFFLAVGKYKTYNRSYVVEAGDVGKTITNRFWGNGTTATGDCDFNVTINSLILDPGISITKVASPTADAPCTNVTFTINVTNTGDCTLDPVKVVDTLPGGMSYVSSDPPADTYDGTIIWDDVGSLGVNESRTITLVAHIDSGLAGTLANNVINATGTPKDSMCGHINDTVTYCYNVTNTGDVTLTNVTVNDIIATVNATDPLGESVTYDDDCTINELTHISLPAWWKGSEERER